MNTRGVAAALLRRAVLVLFDLLCSCALFRAELRRDQLLFVRHLGLVGTLTKRVSY